jgi:hypothetical protein
MPDYQHQWMESPEPEDPSNPKGQKYGYGIVLIAFGPNKLYFHGREMPGYNSFMGHDPVNDVTLVIWTNLTLSLDGQPTATSSPPQGDQILTDRNSAGRKPFGGKPNTRVTSRKVSGCREGVGQVSISQKRRKANQRPLLSRRWPTATPTMA